MEVLCVWQKRAGVISSSGVYDVARNDLVADRCLDVCGFLFIPPDAVTGYTDREDGRQYRSRDETEVYEENAASFISMIKSSIWIS